MDAMDNTAGNMDAPELPPTLVSAANPPGGNPAPAPATPSAASPDQPHGRLVSMLNGMFLGMDSFAKAAATGGREGGVQEVLDVRRKDAQLKLEQQKANQELSESKTRIAHTQAMTNMATAQLQVLQHEAPLKFQQLVNENQRNMVSLFKEIGIPPSFILPMIEGQDTETHMQAINGKAGGDLVNNTAIPVHDEKFAGNGNTSGFAFSDLMSKQIPAEKAAPTLTSFQNAIDEAKGILGEKNQAVQVAQGKLDQFKTGSSFSAADMLHFNQQSLAPLSAAIGRQKDITEFQTKQADLKEKQQKSDPLFKMENDPNEMAGEKSAAAIPLLQNKITAPSTSPEDKVRATRLLAQAKSAHQAYLADVASKANAEQQAKQGDPKAAGAMLANGDLTLADMKTRGMTGKFMLETVNAAKAIDPSYKPADEMIAEQVAKNPGANQFFGSANSLIAKNGTLDQVMDQGAKLPNHDFPIFNKVADAENYAAGHKEVASYLMTALGAADDYAKVIGGGQPSEHMQMLIFNKLNASLNNDMRKGVVDAMRGGVESQVKERIGTNKFLKRMYGYGLGQGEAGTKEAPAFDPSKDFKPINKPK